MADQTLPEDAFDMDFRLTEVCVEIVAWSILAIGRKPNTDKVLLKTWTFFRPCPAM